MVEDQSMFCLLCFILEINTINPSIGVIAPSAIFGAAVPQRRGDLR